MDVVNFSEDMNLKDRDSVNKFISNGTPGLSKIEDSDVVKFFTLYMSGNTYTEISKSTKTKKDIILYLSQKNQWHTKKMEYFSDISTSFLDKARASKIKSANTVILVKAALGQYISDRMEEFIKTGDSKIIESFDSKTLQNFFKAIEALDKILGGGSGGEGSSMPKIDINLAGNSHKIEEKTNGDVEIIAKTENGDILSLLASYKKSKANN